MNQQRLTTQAHTACRGEQLVHNGGALFPIGLTGSEPPHWLGIESVMAEPRKIDEPAGAMPAEVPPLLLAPSLSGTLPTATDRQRSVQTAELSLAPGEQRQTSVCKRLTNSDESTVLSVSQALESIPFPGAFQRKVVKVSGRLVM